MSRSTGSEAAAEAGGVPSVPDWDEEGSWLDALVRPELGPVSWLEEVAPSARLMAELEGMPSDVVADDYDAIEMVAHWKRLEAYCALRVRLAAAALARRRSMAHGLAALQELSGAEGRGGVAVDASVAADELGFRLGISTLTATRLIASGQAMGGQGVLTGEALAAGEIDAGKADLIVEAVADLGPEAALEVQERVLDRAAHLPPSAVRREVNAACAGVDVEEFEERCRAERAKRRVCRPRALPHGMAGLYAVLPAVEATQLYRAVDAAARSAKAGGDVRTMDQLRADALALMGSVALETGRIGPGVAADDSREAGSGVGAGAGAGTGSGLRSEAADVGDVPRGRARAGRDDGRQTDRVDRRDGHDYRDCDDGQDRDDRQGRDDGRDGDDGRDREGRRDRDDGRDRESRRDRDDGRDRAPSEAAATTRRDAAPGAAPPDPPGTGAQVRPAPGMRVGVIGGRSAHVRVVVPLNVLMEAADLSAGGEDSCDREPAHLEGYGAIPGSVARALAAGSTWARLVTDPVDGSVRELSAATYRPPAALADLVRAERPVCIRPGCSVTADSCDLNHNPPWPIGATEFDHLDPACRRDHELITHAGWSYEVSRGSSEGGPIRGGVSRGGSDGQSEDRGVVHEGAVRGGPDTGEGRRGPVEGAGRRGPVEGAGRRGPVEGAGRRGPVEGAGRGGPVEGAGPSGATVDLGIPTSPTPGAQMHWTTGSGHVYTEDVTAEGRAGAIRLSDPRASRSRRAAGIRGAAEPAADTWGAPPY